MGVFDAAGDAHQIAGGDAAGQRAAGQPFGEAGAFDEVHAVIAAAVLDADLVDGNDVGVAQAGGGRGLGMKSLEVVFIRNSAGQDHLDGHVAAQPQVAGLAVNIEHAHAAAAQFVKKLVVADALDDGAGAVGDGAIRAGWAGRTARRPGGLWVRTSARPRRWAGCESAIGAIVAGADGRGNGGRPPLSARAPTLATQPQESRKVRFSAAPAAWQRSTRICMALSDRSPQNSPPAFVRQGGAAATDLADKCIVGTRTCASPANPPRAADVRGGRNAMLVRWAWASVRGGNCIPVLYPCGKARYTAASSNNGRCNRARGFE